jgi:hypothetical protein
MTEAQNFFIFISRNMNRKKKAKKEEGKID